MAMLDAAGSPTLALRAAVRGGARPPMSVAVDEPEQSAHLVPRHFPALSTRDLVPERAVIDSMRYERVSLTGSKQKVIWGAPLLVRVRERCGAKPTGWTRTLILAMALPPGPPAISTTLLTRPRSSTSKRRSPVVPRRIICLIANGGSSGLVPHTADAPTPPRRLGRRRHAASAADGTIFLTGTVRP